jgi:hypothetical protein
MADSGKVSELLSGPRSYAEEAGIKCAQQAAEWGVATGTHNGG